MYMPVHSVTLSPEPGIIHPYPVCTGLSQIIFESYRIRSQCVGRAPERRDHRESREAGERTQRWYDHQRQRGNEHTTGPPITVQGSAP